MDSKGLDSQIWRLRRRVRLLLIERYGLFGGGVGAVLATCMVILSTQVTSLLDYRIWFSTVIAGILGGCAFALTRPLRDLTVAIAADKRTGLKERLSTAIAFADPSPSEGRGGAVSPRPSEGEGSGVRVGSRAFPTDFEQALVTDANEHFSGLKASEVFRHRFGPPHVAFLAAVVLLLGVTFIPQMARFNSPARQQDIATMKQEGATLLKISKEIEKRAGDRQKDLKKLAGKLDDLGRKMQTGRMPKKEAMISSQRLNKQIKAEQDRLAKENSTTKSMAEAQAEMKKAAEELARDMARKMAEKQNIPPAEALRKLASDKRMAELAQKSEPLTESERKELEKAVEKYTNPNSSLAIPKELGEALAKLAENEDFKKASELMQKLTQKAQGGQMKEADREALQKQLDALAKALKGTDLNKLAKMMRENAERLAKMSPEELAKMTKEMQSQQQLAEALKHAGGT